MYPENLKHNMTPATERLFRDLVEWAPDWSGQPLVEITKEERGNLTDLKQRNLLVTHADPDGGTFAAFTTEGIDLAVSMGYEFMKEYR